jgi:hypothetical protein
MLGGAKCNIVVLGMLWVFVKKEGVLAFVGALNGIDYA